MHFSALFPRFYALFCETPHSSARLLGRIHVFSYPRAGDELPALSVHAKETFAHDPLLPHLSFGEGQRGKNGALRAVQKPVRRAVEAHGERAPARKRPRLSRAKSGRSGVLDRSTCSPSHRGRAGDRKRAGNGDGSLQYAAPLRARHERGCCSPGRRPRPFPRRILRAR